MSTANKISLPLNIPNTSQLRTVYGTIAAQLAAAGLVQTSDTGQCTPSTLVFNTFESGLNYGYQMWKFGDSLQSTAPFFIRIAYQGGEYTSGSSTQTQLNVQFGTATDGAGNLTGTQQTDTYTWGADMNTGEAGFSLNSYFSGSTNRFCMAYNDGPNLFNSAVWGFERTKALNGDDTSDGLLFAFCSNGGNGIPTIATGMLPATSGGGPFATAQPYWPLAFNRVLPTMANGSYIGVALPGYFNTYPCVPGLNFCCYLGTDFTAYASQSLPMYDGNNHNYMTLTGSPAVSPSNPAGAHILMRFE